MPKYRFKRVPAAADLHFEDGDVRELPEAFSQFPWWIPVVEEEPVMEIPIVNVPEVVTEAIVVAEEVPVEAEAVVEIVKEPIPEKRPKRSRRSKK